MNIVLRLASLHDRFFQGLAAMTGAWLPGLLARLVFLAVLGGYFFNSALTKIGNGWFGFLHIQPSAWYQIAPQAVEAAGGDIDAVGFFPWGLIVHASSWAEFVLPCLIIAGLFTRIAALGMIVFITVQSLVDIAVHKVDGATIGALFDRFPDSAILDQRSLWLFVLAVLVLKGPGLLSLDGVLSAKLPQSRRSG